MPHHKRNHNRNGNVCVTQAWGHEFSADWCIVYLRTCRLHSAVSEALVWNGDRGWNPRRFTMPTASPLRLWEGPAQQRAGRPVFPPVSRSSHQSLCVNEGERDWWHRSSTKTGFFVVQPFRIPEKIRIYFWPQWIWFWKVFVRDVSLSFLVTNTGNVGVQELLVFLCEGQKYFFTLSSHKQHLNVLAHKFVRLLIKLR